MAASADSVNTNTDTPTSQDISFENDGPKSPVSLQSGQWQTYVSDKTPVSQKKTWKSKYERFYFAEFLTS